MKEENQLLKKEVAQLRTSISELEKEVGSQKPLSKAEVKSLVVEIAKQPKIVEEEALRITEELKRHIKRVESLLEEVKALISG